MEERLQVAAASGPGNKVILFGSTTGPDGVGGASVLASAEFGEADGDKRPSVQVGDPFAEKKLMECSLELLDRGLGGLRKNLDALLEMVAARARPDARGLHAPPLLGERRVVRMDPREGPQLRDGRIDVCG